MQTLSRTDGRPGPLPSLIQRTPTLTDQTYSALKSLIVSGSMAPGSAHTEAGLARELGISRAPLREALRTLEEEGFIDSQLAQQGFIVTEITQAEVANLYEVRIALESVAAFNAADRVPKESLEQMAPLLDRIEESLRTGDHGEYLEHEFLFHDLWVANCGNPLLTRHVGRLRDHVLRVVNHVDLPIEHTRASLAEHKEILEVFRAGSDADTVRSAVEKHTRNVRDRIGTCLAASNI